MSDYYRENMSTIQQTFDGSIDDQPIYNDDGEKRCHECGGYFSRIGQHWRQSNCPYPSLTEYQHELITGMMLGDGWVSLAGRNNPMFFTEMVNRDFVQWLKNELGYIMTDTVSIRQSSNRVSDELTKNSNFLDTYTISSHTLPSLHEYCDWYEDGRSHPVGNVTITPSMLKMWYVSDGSKLTCGSGSEQLILSRTKECDSIVDMFVEEFRDIGLDFEWWEYENKSDAMRFSVEDSREMWEYMGEAPPGFEYKWPDSGVVYDDFVRENTTVDGK